MGKGRQHKIKQDPTSLELLYLISREIAAHLHLETLLNRILELTVEHVGGLSGAIFALEEDGSVMAGSILYQNEIFIPMLERSQEIIKQGLAGWVVNHNQPIVIQNTHNDERWLRAQDTLGDANPRSAISVPLRSFDSVVGAITLVHPDLEYYGDEHLELLSAIAEQAGMAVNNARIYKAERERRNLLATMQEITKKFSSALEPETVFPEILKQLVRVLEFDSASILVLDHDHLRLVASTGFVNPEQVFGTKIPVDPANLSGQVLSHRKPMVVENVQQEPGWVQRENADPENKIHGWIGVPLIVMDRAVGVLTADSHTSGAFSTHDAEVMALFADQAATAVANTQLFTESQRRLDALEELADAAMEVTASLDLDEVLQRIMAQTKRSLNVEAASLSLLDEETDQLEFRAAIGKGAEEILGLRIQRGKGIAGWVADHGKPIVTTDVQAEPLHYSEIDQQIGFKTRALACAPILVHGKPIGALEAINPAHLEFFPHEIELLMGIAGLAGTAIAHARMYSESQAAKRRYAGLFEGSIDPILISDLSARITDANQRAQDFLGKTLDELLGESVSSLQNNVCEDAPLDPGALKSGEALTYTCHIIHEDGLETPVEVYLKRIDIGQEPVLQWILRDISERMALDELRTDLTSMIFHDLRSPLGNIISSLEILQSTFSEPDETVQTVISIADRSSRRLSRLIDSLLDLSRLESGMAVLNKSEGSISRIVLDAIEECLPFAEGKNHRLSADLSAEIIPVVKFDLDMIRRVLNNLIDNAIKYTSSGGEINVIVEKGEQEVIVRVRDNGPGIAKRDQKEIFEKFSRLRKRGKPIKGLGLGLAFCRLAVEAHGGRIWVDSSLGKGATFSFTLPV
ncbi:MAG: GAF domain-containing protein [Anaerolineales bacterium]|nr:GAF domain-containing protein [Anaerolineales bacterium]